MSEFSQEPHGKAIVSSSCYCSLHNSSLERTEGPEAHVDDEDAAAMKLIDRLLPLDALESSNV